MGRAQKSKAQSKAKKQNSDSCAVDDDINQTPKQIRKSSKPVATSTTVNRIRHSDRREGISHATNGSVNHSNSSDEESKPSLRQKRKLTKTTNRSPSTKSSKRQKLQPPSKSRGKTSSRSQQTQKSSRHSTGHIKSQPRDVSHDSQEKPDSLPDISTKMDNEVSNAGCDKKTSGKLVGAHCSIAGGLHKAVEEAVSLGGQAFGMFMRSQRTWTSKPLDPDAAEKFKAACKEHGFPPNSILPHGSYLMNCGSPNPDTLKKSRNALLDELRRCEALGLTLYNFHPGSTCGEISIEESLDKIAESINWAHGQTKFVTTAVKSETICRIDHFNIFTAQGKQLVMYAITTVNKQFRNKLTALSVLQKDEVKVIENMSCQGNTVGGRFEELKGIIDRVKDKSRIGVCLDTCHAFAAGFDLSSKEGFEKFLSDFHSIVGFQYLRAMHLNDSKGAVGCHLDRHENIGKGKIGLEGFRRVMQEPRFSGIPMILETPLGDYAKEIATLKKMI